MKNLQKFTMFTAIALMLLGVFAVSTSAQVVSQWNFDGDALDSVGGRDLTLVGAPLYSTNTAPGQSGMSLNLTGGGNGAWYDVPGGDTLSGSWTLSMWVNPNSSSANSGSFFGTRGPSDTSFDAKFQNITQMHGDIGTGGGWLTTGADANVDYRGGAWQHVAYSVEPGSYTAYINGVPVGGGTFGAGAPLLFDQNHDIAIGGYRASDFGENFEGLVDNVRIHSSALTAAAVVNEVAPPGSTRVSSLYSTGVDNAGVPLGNNVPDPHWSLTVDPSGLGANTVTDDGFPVGTWRPNDGTSRWIGPADGGDAYGPAGNYTYSTTFDLSGFDPDTAMILGAWGSDNDGVDILLNGNSVGAGQLTGAESATVETDAFASATPLFIDDGFIDGINTLDFIVNNAPGADSPQGFRVSLNAFAQEAAVPEPASIAIWTLLAGVGAGFGFRRLRKNK